MGKKLKTVSEVGLMALTGGALGPSVGLWLGKKLRRKARTALGFAAAGVAISAPIALYLLGKKLGQNEQTD